MTQIHLDRCLSCRACETTCPSGVEYHRLFDVGRQVVARRAPRPWFERAVRGALRGLVPHPRRLALLMPMARALRLAPRRADPGAAPREAHGRRMVLLAGCVQAAAAPRFNAAAARVFDTVGIGLDEAAGCCGALSFHLDAPDEARALARRNIDAWTADLDAGAEAIVVAGSGCAAFIRDYPDVLADDPTYAMRARRVAAAVRDPVEILAATPPAADRAPSRPRVAVHDPCTLQNGPGLAGAVARLLTSLGYDPVPVAEAHLCCGSAGAYSLLQPAFARRLRADKLAALTAGAPVGDPDRQHRLLDAPGGRLARPRPPLDRGGGRGGGRYSWTLTNCNIYVAIRNGREKARTQAIAQPPAGGVRAGDGEGRGAVGGVRGGRLQALLHPGRADQETGRGGRARRAAPRGTGLGGSGDLAPVINEMRRLAVAAGELGTAAGMMAAKGFLVEAARLKGMLPVELAPLPRRLTNEEWLAKHKPKP